MRKYSILFILAITICGCNGKKKSQIQEKEIVKIACVGNSITYGAGMADRENNAYPAQLQNMLGDAYEVKNFGVNGRTLLKNGDFPYWETEQYQEALSYNPDIVFIKLGTNDAKQQNRVHMGEFESNYKSLIASFRNKNEKARIVLLLPVPSYSNDSTGIWNPIIKDEITPITQKVAYDLNLETIDLYQLFVGNPGLMPDEIHPSSLGATIMAKRAYEAVKQLPDTFNLIQTLQVKDAQKSNFHGFAQYDFELEGLQLKIVQPKRTLEDKPWVWRARFFGHEPQTDVALLERGYHIVYCEVGTYFGNPEAVKRWNKCYDIMTKAGLSQKPALEGMSRGGLIVYNWAAQNLDKVACIYADAPVLDAQSWPGGFGVGKGSSTDWEQAKMRYGLNSDTLRADFKGWPISKAELFAKSGIPMLHVCGEADEVVPVDENTRLFAKKIEELGGNIKTIYKNGVGHHPHSLQNPTPIVNFILRATGQKTNFATIPAPGSEYRSGAGWIEGRGWWSQAKQIDSLCQASGDVDLLLIGNSITQGWGGPRSWVTYKPGQLAAEAHFKGIKWIGAGISGDRTQHIAWRLEKGKYETCKPKIVSLAIGVNNFPEDSVDEIVEGLKKTLEITEKKFPKSTILFFGPLPTGLDPTSDRREKYRKIHAKLGRFKYPRNIQYHNLEQYFSNEDGTLKNEDFSNDGIHLQPKGYETWAMYIRKQFDKINQP
ncbi:GDSL-type esterase/lipase family protein [Flagellimonas pacifica]|uniref:Lysophospholipase L1 n=1 Tax=Flagellimonas pacifica TaxID=1247520 RepID=A0A285MXX1_9FLAO|nr:GDSL-type esterase/lipase family protein [Allomuricauda parva]SNZ02070.1 Lysophospholipase L1 [Allomuricauda parva]